MLPILASVRGPVCLSADSVPISFHRIPHLKAAVMAMVVVVFTAGIPDASARQTGTPYSSRNISLISHHPLGGARAVEGATTGGFESLGRRTGNLIVEQDTGRPFVYVARRYNRSGFAAIDLSDAANPKIVFEWSFESDHTGVGATDITYFKESGRFFLALGVQFAPDDRDADLAIIIFDVTDIASGRAHETSRIHRAGGYHHLFAYRHSNGHSYLFGTGGGSLDMFDIASLEGEDAAPVSELQIPEEIANIDYGFHSMEAAYHAESEVDRLYAGGAGGYYVYDISAPDHATIIATVSSAAIQIGHEVAPTPDGTHLVTTAGYRASPLRIFDIRPAFSDEPQATIRTAAGAWVANWRNRAQNVAVRWPFIFIASMEDGFQAVNMRNPLQPYTTGFYKTWTGKASDVSSPGTDRTGAWDIDVRNNDGLIVVTDVNTGLWVFRMEGFTQWDGRGWGYPNISSVQNWDDGPVNAMAWPADEDLQP